jgi:hypothetical protein
MQLPEGFLQIICCSGRTDRQFWQQKCLYLLPGKPSKLQEVSRCHCTIILLNRNIFTRVCAEMCNSNLIQMLNRLCLETWSVSWVYCMYSFGYFPGTDSRFRNVGKSQSDAGEIPKRIHTIFKTRRKLKIKNLGYTFSIPSL